MSRSKPNRDGQVARQAERRGWLGWRSSLVLLCVVGGAISGSLLMAASGKATRGGGRHAAVWRRPTHLTTPHLRAGAKLPITTANGTITYQPEGITVSAAPAGYSAPMSSSAVVSSFQQQVIPEDAIGPTLSSETPTVTLNLVSDNRSTPANEFPGWVVVYHNTSPQSYGPAPVAADPVCDFVGIYDLDTSQWSEFFQDCPT
jgi:hypothetical protein